MVSFAQELCSFNIKQSLSFKLFCGCDCIQNSLQDGEHFRYPQCISFADCLARLGERALLISAVGGDARGDAVLSHCSHMVGVRPVRVLTLSHVVGVSVFTLSHMIGVSVLTLSHMIGVSVLTLSHMIGVSVLTLSHMIGVSVLTLSHMIGVSVFTLSHMIGVSVLTLSHMIGVSVLTLSHMVRLNVCTEKVRVSIYW